MVDIASVVWSTRVETVPVLFVSVHTNFKLVFGTSFPFLFLITHVKVGYPISLTNYVPWSETTEIL